MTHINSNTRLPSQLRATAPDLDKQPTPLITAYQPVGDTRLLLTVLEAARRLNVSRSLMYELLAAGEIESVHVGRLRRIPVDALTAYVARLRAHGHSEAS